MTKLKHWSAFIGIQNEGNQEIITLWIFGDLAPTLKCNLSGINQLRDSFCSCSRTLTFDLTKYREA
jgi:hypothetical protein